MAHIYVSVRQLPAAPSPTLALHHSHTTSALKPRRPQLLRFQHLSELSWARFLSSTGQRFGDAISRGLATAGLEVIYYGDVQQQEGRKMKRVNSGIKYEYYFALLRDFPELQFTLNGGITCIDQVDAAIRQGAYGVMVGRAAYNNPWYTLGHVDSAIYGVPYHRKSRRQILEQYQDYADSVIGKCGSRTNVRQLVKPLLHLFHSEPANNQWKRMADASLRHCKTMKSFLDETLGTIPDYVLDSTLANTPSSHEEQFTDVDSLIPPPYSRSQKLTNFSEDEGVLSGSLL